MAFPSGAHWPPRSPRLSAGAEKVICRAFSLPSTAASQKWVLPPSAVASVTVNSTSLPSGESRGALMVFRWRSSSLVGKCGTLAAGAAPAGAWAADWASLSRADQDREAHRAIADRDRKMAERMPTEYMRDPAFQ